MVLPVWVGNICEATWSHMWFFICLMFFVSREGGWEFHPFYRAALPTLLSLRSPTHAGGIWVYQRVFRNHAAGKLDPWQIALSAIFQWQKHDLIAAGWNCNLSCAYPDCIRSVTATKKSGRIEQSFFFHRSDVQIFWCDYFCIFIRIVMCVFADTVRFTPLHWRAYPRAIWLYNILLYITCSYMILQVYV